MTMKQNKLLVTGPSGLFGSDVATDFEAKQCGSFHYNSLNYTAARILARHHASVL